MRKRTFGRTGWQVGEVGYGMWGMGGWSGSDDDESLGSLELAAGRGVTFFDTAQAYGDGHSERLLARLLAAHPGSIYGATKVPPRNRTWPSRRGVPLADVFPGDYLREYVDISRTNMGVKAIDLLQLHVWEDDWLGSGGLLGRRGRGGGEVHARVLVPGTGQPVRGHRRGERATDHEAEIARPVHRREPGVRGGRKLGHDPFRILAVFREGSRQRGADLFGTGRIGPDPALGEAVDVGHGQLGGAREGRSIRRERLGRQAGAGWFGGAIGSWVGGGHRSVLGGGLRRKPTATGLGGREARRPRGARGRLAPRPPLSFPVSHQNDIGQGSGVGVRLATGIPGSGGAE